MSYCISAMKVKRDLKTNDTAPPDKKYYTEHYVRRPNGSLTRVARECTFDEMLAAAARDRALIDDGDRLRRESLSQNSQKQKALPAHSETSLTRRSPGLLTDIYKQPQRGKQI